MMYGAACERVDNVFFLAVAGPEMVFARRVCVEAAREDELLRAVLDLLAGNDVRVWNGAHALTFRVLCGAAGIRWSGEVYELGCVPPEGRLTDVAAMAREPGLPSVADDATLEEEV